MDEGNPTSTASAGSIRRLCDIIGRPVKIEKARSDYRRGWGPYGSDSMPIIGLWSITIQDINDKPTTLDFDVTDDDSPITVGMDVQRYCVTDNLSTPRRVVMKRPRDTDRRTLNTYISGFSPLEHRLRLEITPIPCATNALIGHARRRPDIRPATLAKRIHNITHAPASEAIRICKQAGWLNDEVEKAIEKVSRECETCARSGRPPPSKKLSLTHVNQDFNDEVQGDFTFVDIRGRKYTVIHYTCTGTSYSEASIVENRRWTTLVNELDKIWIFHHGAPAKLSADDEFNRRPIVAALTERSIEFHPRPPRRHNKVGIIERKNQTLKRIVERLQLDEQCTDSPSKVLAKAVFLSNAFAGSRTLSAFQLARGYCPTIVGNPSYKICDEMVEAHKQQMAARALNRLLRSRNHGGIDPSSIKPGDEILYFYESSIQSEKKEWKSGTVIHVLPHYVEISGKSNGRSVRIAYDDIRLKPKSAFAQRMMEWTDHAPGGESVNISDDAQSGQICDITQTPADWSASASQQNKVDSHALWAIHDEDKDGMEKDIGSCRINTKMPTGRSLRSTEMDILKDIEDKIGTSQVTASALAFAPSWIVEKAMKAEHDENWKDAYTEVEESSLPHNSNVVSSHSIFKIKTLDDGEIKLKGRIVVHGNRDSEKDLVRGDCASADMLVIRLVIAIGTCLGFLFGTGDIKGAFMQSGPIKRDVYVRPPRDCYRKRGIVWKLLKLPYGLVDAGRQWLIKIESWMIEEYGLERVFGVSQLFIKRRESRIVLIIAKVTDDFW